MQRLVLRYRHDCPFVRLSEAIPSLVMTQWCNYRRDVLSVQITDPTDRPALDAGLTRLAAQGFRTLGVRDDGEHGVRIVMSCAHSRGMSVEDTVASHGGLVLPPVVYQAGWERYRILVLEPGAARKITEAMGRTGEVRTVSKKPFDEQHLDHGMVLSSHDIIGDLTERQRYALVAAVAQGYYEVPRKAKFADIAKRVGVPRTTFEEHARKAEAKVIRAVAPYLSLYRAKKTAPPKAARAGAGKRAVAAGS